ncbi:hypothetical protein V502_03184, partial [Pseudogymnoascus sp. VKM F-4520 (FW-2644)]
VCRPQLIKEAGEAGAKVGTSRGESFGDGTAANRNSSVQATIIAFEGFSPKQLSNIQCGF